MASATARAAWPFVLVLLAIGVLSCSGGLREPVPTQERCVATASGRSVALDLDQARYASIIAGLSVNRGLPPRAASIALATAYQESGIRNLDYGDRDSVGLFQQRPSQGWGSEEQVMDPYYATGRFYSALVKISGWQTTDINDVAQAVQRSGHPEAYRDHEADARVLASTLTGHSPAGFSCLERVGAAGDARGLHASLKKSLGPVEADRDENTITITADSATLAWAYGHYAVANAAEYGVIEVVVGDQHWQTGRVDLPEWTPATNTVRRNQVTIIVR